MQMATERSKGIVLSDVRMTAKKSERCVTKAVEALVKLAESSLAAIRVLSMSFADQREKKSATLDKVAKDLALLHSEVAR